MRPTTEQLELWVQCISLHNDTNTYFTPCADFFSICLICVFLLFFLWQDQTALLSEFQTLFCGGNQVTQALKDKGKGGYICYYLSNV